MMKAENRAELTEKGYTVVPGVLTDAEADQLKQRYQDWLQLNFPNGEFPDCDRSLIHQYKSGHLGPTWAARLKCQPVFAELWGTDQLLTSMDCVAIGRPPESGQEQFRSEDTCWLHVDQSPRRLGLHCYQGALYLEQADQQDWTLEVMEGSHRLFQEFWEQHPEEHAEKLAKGSYIRLTADQRGWMRERGCRQTSVAVPKGGLVLWDSRLVHANAHPVKGRAHPDRWRYVVIVCMAPASWASQQDLDLKRQAYEGMALTHHWPSQGVRLFKEKGEKVKAAVPLLELPPEARTPLARRLAGVEPYPHAPDNAPPPPAWVPGYTHEMDD